MKVTGVLHKEASRKRRRQFMLCLRRQGYTLQQIADRFGVCRERIRQMSRRAEREYNRDNNAWVDNLLTVNAVLKGDIQRPARVIKSEDDVEVESLPTGFQFLYIPNYWDVDEQGNRIIFKKREEIK